MWRLSLLSMLLIVVSVWETMAVTCRQETWQLI